MTETEKKTKTRTAHAGDPKCILLTATNKAVKKPWNEAFDLVNAGKARFISRTEFKAHTNGVKIPP